MVDKLNKNLSGHLLEDELHTDVGSSSFTLDHDTILADGSFTNGENIDIWTSSNQSGTQLIEGTDYSLEGKDTDLTNEAGNDVYTTVTITNGTYQTGDLYFTYKSVGDYTDAADINYHSDRHRYNGDDSINQLDTSENLSDLIPRDGSRSINGDLELTNQNAIILGGRYKILYNSTDDTLDIEVI